MVEAKTLCLQSPRSPREFLLRCSPGGADQCIERTPRRTRGQARCPAEDAGQLRPAALARPEAQPPDPATKKPRPSRPGVARALAEHPDITIEATLDACPHCQHTLGPADHPRSMPTPPSPCRRPARPSPG